MSEQLFNMAGTKLFISDKPVPGKLDVTAADFASVNWVEVKGLFNVGELGGEQAVNEVELLSSDWVMKSKGVRNGGTMTNTFIPLALDPGQKKFMEAVEDACRPYAFKVERGADCIAEEVVTFTIAAGSATVVNWPAHGQVAGQPIVFTNEGGALPTGMTAGTVYYIAEAGLTDDAFTVSATEGGAAIEATGAATGTTTASAAPAGMVDMFQGFALDGARSGGARSDNYTRSLGIAVNGKIITV